MTTLFSAEEPSLRAGKIAETGNSTPALSPYFENFLRVRENYLRNRQSLVEPMLRVSDVLGSIAFLYERIRNVIEYKGEHVLRRNAIERILKRLLWERPGHDTGRISTTLLRELIWARYLPNDILPKSTAFKISKIISKYLYLLDKLLNRSKLPQNRLKEWVWGVASSEIEESLDPTQREPYVKLMYEWFNMHFIWQDGHISLHEKEIQTYVAIARSLAKSDDEIISYRLLISEYPSWVDADKPQVDQFVERFDSLFQEINRHLTFPARFLLYRQIQKQVAQFNILRAVIETPDINLRQILQDQSEFSKIVRDVCLVKYAHIQKKVNRGIVRSVIYIFITKVLIALILEVPYEMYRYGALTILPISINVILPPILMWLIGLTIKPPGEKNTRQIQSKLNTVVYAQENISPALITVLKGKQGSVLQNLFAAIYLVLFLCIFGVISWFLLLMQFTFVGIAVFFAFLSLVLLFGFRVRYNTEELKATPDHQGLVAYFFDNLTLPFLRTGVWLSKGLAKINFFTVIFDFLIEAPLKTIIEVFEAWTSFIREKREEVVEVPEQ